jgi:hypothetical protein
MFSEVNNFMAREVHHQPTAQADLYRAAETAVRSGREQKVEFNGATLTIGRLKPRKPRVRRGAAALTPAEREEILRATSGGWKGLIDPDQLKRDLNELQRDDAIPRSL